MAKQLYKILICGGGTGGHIYPAITIADMIKKILLKKNYLVEFLFLGSKGNMERNIVSQAGYNIIDLWISGIPKKITKEFFLFPFKIIKTYKDCINIFSYFSPNIVIGTGGYVSGIPIYIAYRKKICVFIQEQNIIPGYTNKKIGWNYANKIFVADKKSLIFLPKEKTIVTGNPIRSKILYLSYNRKESYKRFRLNPDKLIILSIGGSQGSRSINNGWINGIKKLIEEDIQLLWQIGKNDFKHIYNNPNVQHYNIILNEFIDDIHIAYDLADIVVSRAGGLVISELAVLGKPCILIPLPQATQDHQMENAKNLVEKNAALIIKDEEIQKKLVDTAISIVKNKDIKETLSKNILSIKKIDAAEIIAKEIIKFL